MTRSRTSITQAQQDHSDFAFLASFGAFVALMRARKGWSQNQFAQLVAVSQSVVSRIENGATSTSLTDFIIISDQLGVPPQKTFILVRDATFMVKATAVRLRTTDHTTVTPTTIVALAYAHMNDLLSNEQI